MADIQKIIEDAFDARAELSPANASEPLLDAVQSALDMLDNGTARVAEPTINGWQVNEWLKKAVLVSFRLRDNQAIDGEFTRYYDKVPSKFAHFDTDDFKRQGARVVPPATVRRGAYIGPNVVLMPSYVNIGAYVGKGSMIDTWATVGSCAQVGEGVHLSGGAGLGGVLEPLQAAPTIIEDGCFIGARSEIVEGVRVGKGSVISMGVFIGASTPIYDRQADQISYGTVPAGSVVVAGSLPRANGRYSINAAIIMKTVDEGTRAKVSVNELLRNIE